MSDQKIRIEFDETALTEGLRKVQREAEKALGGISGLRIDRVFQGGDEAARNLAQSLLAIKKNADAFKASFDLELASKSAGKGFSVEKAIRDQEKAAKGYEKLTKAAMAYQAVAGQGGIGAGAAASMENLQLLSLRQLGQQAANRAQEMRLGAPTDVGEERQDMSRFSHNLAMEVKASRDKAKADRERLAEEQKITAENNKQLAAIKAAMQADEARHAKVGKKWSDQDTGSDLAEIKAAMKADESKLSESVSRRRQEEKEALAIAEKAAKVRRDEAAANLRSAEKNLSAIDRETVALEKMFTRADAAREKQYKGEKTDEQKDALSKFDQELKRQLEEDKRLAKEREELEARHNENLKKLHTEQEKIAAQAVARGKQLAEETVQRRIRDKSYGEITSLTSRYSGTREQLSGAILDQESAQAARRHLSMDRTSENLAELSDFDARLKAAKGGGAEVIKMPSMMGKTGREIEDIRKATQSVATLKGHLGSLKDTASSALSGISKPFMATFAAVEKASFAIWKFQQSIGLAVMAARGLMDIARDAESLANATYSWDKAAGKLGVTMGQLEKASNNTLSKGSIAKLGSFAAESKIAGDDLVKLMERSKTAARIRGTDTEDMFRRAVMGVAKQEKEILDEMTVIMPNAAKIWRDAAKELGKAQKDLTPDEKQAAYVKAFLKASEHLDPKKSGMPEGLDKVAQAQTRMTNAMDEGKIKILEYLDSMGMIQGSAELVEKVLGSKLAEQMAHGLIGTLSGVGQAVLAMTPIFKATSAAGVAFGKALQGLSPLVYVLSVAIGEMIKLSMLPLVMAVGGVILALGKAESIMTGTTSKTEKLGMEILKVGEDIAMSVGRVNDLNDVIIEVGNSAEDTGNQMMDMGIKSIKASLDLANAARQATAALLELEAAKGGGKTGEEKKLFDLRGDEKYLKDNKKAQELMTKAKGGDLGLITSEEIKAASDAQKEAERRAKILYDLYKKTQEFEKLNPKERGPFGMQVDRGEYKEKVSLSDDQKSMLQELGEKTDDVTMQRLVDMSGKLFDASGKYHSVQKSLHQSLSAISDRAKTIDAQQAELSESEKNIGTNLKLLFDQKIENAEFFDSIEKKDSEISSKIESWEELTYVKGAETLDPEKTKEMVRQLIEGPEGKIDKQKAKANRESLEKDIHFLQKKEEEIGNEVIALALVHKQNQERYAAIIKSMQSGGKETNAEAAAALGASESASKAEYAAREQAERTRLAKEQRMEILRQIPNVGSGSGRKKKPTMILPELLDTTDAAFSKIEDQMQAKEKMPLDFRAKQSSYEAQVVLENNKDDIEKYREQIHTMQDEYLSLGQDLMKMMEGAKSIEEFRAAADQYDALERSVEAIQEWFPDKDKVKAVERKIKDYRDMTEKQVQALEKIVDMTKAMNDDANELLRKQFELQTEESISIEHTSMLAQREDMGDYGYVISKLPQHYLAEAYGEEYQKKLVEFSRAENAIRKKAEEEKKKIQETFDEARLKGLSFSDAERDAGFNAADKKANEGLSLVAEERNALKRQIEEDAARKWIADKRATYTKLGEEAGAILGNGIGGGLTEALVFKLNSSYDEFKTWADMISELMGTLFQQLGAAFAAWASAEIMMWIGNPFAAAIASGAITAAGQALGGLFQRKIKDVKVDEIAQKELKRQREKREDKFTVTVINNGLAISNQQARELARTLSAANKARAA